MHRLWGQWRKKVEWGRVGSGVGSGVGSKYVQIGPCFLVVEGCRFLAKVSKQRASRVGWLVEVVKGNGYFDQQKRMTVWKGRRVSGLGVVVGSEVRKGGAGGGKGQEIGRAHV